MAGARADLQGPLGLPPGDPLEAGLGPGQEDRRDTVRTVSG